MRIKMKICPLPRVCGVSAQRSRLPLSDLGDDVASTSPRTRALGIAARWASAKTGGQSASLQAGESRSKKSWSALGSLSLAGHRSTGSTRKALARQINSKSATHRSCVSIFARVSLLRSHPHRRQRAASIGCVKPCWFRSLRICGPTKLRGFFMSRSQNRNRRQGPNGKGSEFRTRISKHCACTFRADFAKVSMSEGQIVALIRSMRHGEGQTISRKPVGGLPHLLPSASFRFSKANMQALLCPIATKPTSPW